MHVHYQFSDFNQYVIQDQVEFGVAAKNFQKYAMFHNNSKLDLPLDALTAIQRLSTTVSITEK